MSARLSVCLLSLAVALVCGCARQAPIRAEPVQNTRYPLVEESPPSYVIACEGCDAGYLERVSPSVARGMDSLVEFTGSDVLEQSRPVTFHLTADDACPDHDGVYYREGHACLFAVEHWFSFDDIAYFSAMMGFAAWADGRVSAQLDEGVGEIMRYVALATNSPLEDCGGGAGCDPCTVISSPKYLPTVTRLCNAGLRVDQMKDALRRIDRAASAKGQPLGRGEVLGIFKDVLRG